LSLIKLIELRSSVMSKNTNDFVIANHFNGLQRKRIKKFEIQNRNYNLME